MNLLRKNSLNANCSTLWQHVNKLNPIVCNVVVRTFKDLPDPPPKIGTFVLSLDDPFLQYLFNSYVNFVEIGFPDQNRLKTVPKQPTYPPAMLTPKMTKKTELVRGPELIHNKLIHKQYGIVALSGGFLHHGHFEMIRNTINRNLDLKNTFAEWRVDPPWKPVTRHGQGKKLGGGKGAIDHYVTPVKRGRIIVEVAGSMPYQVVERFMIDVAQKLPFPARMVTQKDLDEWAELDKRISKENVNNLRWEWCIKNNILNSINYVSKYDIEFSHLGPECR
jgi:large subunit ribosomal protein L16